MNNNIIFIDWNGLKCAIDAHKMRHILSPFIVMNTRTLNVLKAADADHRFDINEKNSIRLFNCPVAICDGMAFSDVKLVMEDR